MLRWCSLFAVCSLMFGATCGVLVVGCYLLYVFAFVVCRLGVVCCLVFGVWCLLFVVCCVIIIDWWLLYVVVCC